MPLVPPDPLPEMPVLAEDVLTELDEYGIRDITTIEPVLGLKGIIKDAALFVSTMFEFKGRKLDENQILAFPRVDISETFDYIVPDCVKLAQMLYILDILAPCDQSGLKSLGLTSLLERVGERWSEKFYSTNPFIHKLNAVMEPVLKNDGSTEFIYETENSMEVRYKG